MNEEKTLTPSQVEEEYGIPYKTLNNWRWQKKGPKYIKAGKRILYRVRDIQRFLERCEVQTTEDMK